MAQDYPRHQGAQGVIHGNMDMLPKPTAGKIPMLITGGKPTIAEWVAANGDGWITYPRDPISQARVIGDYRQRIADKGDAIKPVTNRFILILSKKRMPIRAASI